MNDALTVSTGNVTTGGVGTTGGWMYPYDTYDPYRTITIANWPQYYQTCAGNLHVFGCDHAERCLCGMAKRKVVPKVCPHCHKAHD